MSNYVWKQVESIRQDMVSVLKDSGFEVMLMPNKLTINRGNEKVVEVNDATVGKYCKKVMEALEDVAWKYSDITYKWRYGDGPYQEDSVPCLWFTVKFGGAKYKFKYTLPLQMWAKLQNHTEKFVEEHGLDKKLTKTVLVRMGLDYLFNNITIVDVVTAKTTKGNIRKAWKVIESDIGEVYMPYGKYSTIFTHSISNDYTVYIVNRQEGILSWVCLLKEIKNEYFIVFVVIQKT